MQHGIAGRRGPHGNLASEKGHWGNQHRFQHVTRLATLARNIRARQRLLASSGALHGGTHSWHTNPIPTIPTRAGLSEDECAVRRASTVSTMSCKPIPNWPKAPPAAPRSRCSRVAIAVVLGALFYGLNNTSVNQRGTTPPSQTAQQTSPAQPGSASGMRDRVTPRANSEPGTTTGAAPCAAVDGSPPAPSAI